MCLSHSPERLVWMKVYHGGAKWVIYYNVDTYFEMSYNNDAWVELNDGGRAYVCKCGVGVVETCGFWVGVVGVVLPYLPGGGYAPLVWVRVVVTIMVGLVMV